MAIPRKVFLFWHTADIPHDVRQVIDSWRDIDGSEVEIYDDAAARRFLRSEFDEKTLRLYDTCNLPAMRSDFFRLGRALRGGGLYADAGIKCLASPDPFFEDGYDLICIRRREGWLTNGIFSCPPGSPVVRRIFDQVSANIERRSSNNLWLVTGPGAWNQALGKHYDDQDKNIKIVHIKDIAKKYVLLGQITSSGRTTERHWSVVQKQISIFREPDTRAETGEVPANSKLDGVTEYLKTTFKSISGWCNPHLWQTIQPVHMIQQELGVSAPVAEIGVFHGKFFIGLVKTKNYPSHNLAIDVFDMQKFNLDGSGRGSAEEFTNNLRRSDIPSHQVEILKRDSMSITPSSVSEIAQQTGGFSLFSVDGCHMVEHTINDINLALDLTLPEGIIFVDDYYNANWPGVQEGVARLYLLQAPRFVPLAYTCNKLLLCHISYHDTYINGIVDFVRKHFPRTRMKKHRRFGYDTLSIFPAANDEVYISADSPKT